MTSTTLFGSRLDAKRQEQLPQATARLAIVALFIVMWGFLWALRIPMPLPFLGTLAAEGIFFFIYLRAVFVIPSARGVQLAYGFMLAAEILFHTIMVYYLGGATWLGAFAYVFGLIFTNAFLDLKAGLLYTAGASGAFMALLLLDASGTIPHYSYIEPSIVEYNPQFLITTMLGGAGVFFAIYLWVNWVGHQLRIERDTAVRVQDELMVVRAQLEDRVRQRTADLMQANVALSGSQDLLRATIESTADGILVVDSNGRAALTNERFVQMWNIPRDVLDTRDDARLLEFVLDQLADPDAFMAKVRDLYQTSLDDLDNIAFKDDRVFERFSRPLLRDGSPVGRVWSFRDITDHKRAEEVLRRQARHDALTSTLNHASITDILRELARVATTASPIAVIMVDVDGMKAVNDAYGHQTGDDVLITIAAALSRDDAVVGRYGGDEFLVALNGVTRDEAEGYCRRVVDAMGLTHMRERHTGSAIPVIASIGLAMYPEEAETIEEAIRLADHAMYSAKRERSHLDGAPASRSTLADERAARMIGEIVPLLTSPGDLSEKLRLVAHRLSVGAGYDFVRFTTGNGSAANGPDSVSTVAKMPGEMIDAWDRNPNAEMTRRLGEMLQKARSPILLDDPASDERFSPVQREILRSGGVKTLLLVPMISQDEMVGVLSVLTTSDRVIDARDMQFLSNVATQVTAIFRTEALVEELRTSAARLKDARADTVILLAAAAEAHDQTTGRHLHRVRDITEALARELGYRPDDVHAVGLGAVLHDIGKIRVPETILLSPAQLGDDDWELMKQHTTWGAEFLAGRPGFEMAATIAAAHHERWDGSGYPLGLAGESIPDVAAIVSVADSLDAITNDRPYRTGRTLDWAVREIKRCSGQQFSPRVVDALVRLHERHELPLPGDDGLQDLAA